MIRNTLYIYFIGVLCVLAFGCSVKKTAVNLGRTDASKDFACIAVLPFTHDLEGATKSNQVLGRAFEHALLAYGIAPVVDLESVIIQEQKLKSEYIAQNNTAGENAPTVVSERELAGRLQVQAVIVGQIHTYDYLDESEHGQDYPFLKYDVQLLEMPSADVIWQAEVERGPSGFSSRARTSVSQIAVESAIETVELMRKTLDLPGKASGARCGAIIERNI